MLKLSKFLRRIQRNSILYEMDYIGELGFHYHKLFFRGLIKSGMKLGSFDYFSNLKNNSKIFTNPYFFFFFTLLKSTPNIILKSKRFGSKRMGLPIPMIYTKQITFAVKLVLNFYREKKRKKVKNNFYNYFLEIYRNNSKVNQLIKNFYKIATDNRHYLGFNRRFVNNKKELLTKFGANLLDRKRFKGKSKGIKIRNFGISKERERIDKNLLLKLENKNKFMSVDRNKLVFANGNKYKFVDEKRKKPKINLKLKYKKRKFFKRLFRKLKKMKVKIISLLKARLCEKIKLRFFEKVERERRSMKKKFPKVFRIKNVNIKILSILKIQLLKILKCEIPVSNTPNFAKIKGKILLGTGPKELEYIEKCLMGNEAELKVKDKMNIYAYFSEISGLLEGTSFINNEWNKFVWRNRVKAKKNAFFIRRVKILYEKKFELDQKERERAERMRKKMEKSNMRINVDFGKILKILSVSRLIFNTKVGEGITLAKRDELARSLEKYLENLPDLDEGKKRCKNRYKSKKANRTKKNVSYLTSISEKRLEYRKRNEKLTEFYTRLRREIDMREPINRYGINFNFVKKPNIKDIELSEYMKWVRNKLVINMRDIRIKARWIIERLYCKKYKNEYKMLGSKKYKLCDIRQKFKSNKIWRKLWTKVLLLVIKIKHGIEFRTFDEKLINYNNNKYNIILGDEEIFREWFKALRERIVGMRAEKIRIQLKQLEGKKCKNLRFLSIK